MRFLLFVLLPSIGLLILVILGNNSNGEESYIPPTNFDQAAEALDYSLANINVIIIEATPSLRKQQNPVQPTITKLPNGDLEIK